ENGKVIKIPETSGYVLITGTVVEKLLNDFTITERQQMSLEPGLSDVFAEVAAETTLDDFAGLDHVICEYSIPVDTYASVRDITTLAEMFNGLVIGAANGQDGIFSYYTAVADLIHKIKGEAHN